MSERQTLTTPPIGYVYGIIINGHVKYVGSTKDFIARQSKHKSQFHGTIRDQPFHRWARLHYQWSDIHFCILDLPPLDRLVEKENYFYDEFQETVHEDCIRPIRDVEADRRRKKAYGKQKVICECGLESMRKNLARHRRSHLHVRLLAAQKMSDSSKQNGVPGGKPVQEEEAVQRRFQAGCERCDDGRRAGDEQKEEESSDEDAQQGEVQ